MYTIQWLTEKGKQWSTKHYTETHWYNLLFYKAMHLFSPNKKIPFEPIFMNKSEYDKH